MNKPTPLNQLLNPAPAKLAWPAPWILLALLALTAIPRIWLAAKTEYVYPDGGLYLNWAEAVERGEPYWLFEGKQPSGYVMVLVLLKRLGLEGETAGKIWGVLISTLTILPLVGWLRRMGDERLAVWGGVLFAVHPELMEWGPELVREPTCWFLLVCTLYALWRALEHGAGWWFCLAGLSLTACIQVRSEGWLLFIPLLIWTAQRLLVLPVLRGRLLLGTCGMCVLLALLPPVCNRLPLFSVGAKETHNWDHWKSFSHWLEAKLRPPPAAETSSVVIVGKPPLSWKAWSWGLRHTLWKGIGPVYLAAVASLALCGWNRWKTRTDWWPLWLMAAAHVVCLGVYFDREREILSRYAGSTFLFLLPAAAAGFSLWSDGLTWLCRKLSTSFPSPRFASHGPALLLAACLMTWGFHSVAKLDHGGRAEKAELGRWLAQEFGTGRTIWGSERFLRLVSYYSGSDLHFYRPGRPQLDQLRHTQADILILSQLPECHALTAEIAAHHASLGYVPYPSPTIEPVLLFVRPSLLSPRLPTVITASPSQNSAPK